MSSISADEPGDPSEIIADLYEGLAKFNQLEAELKRAYDEAMQKLAECEKASRVPA